MARRGGLSSETTDFIINLGIVVPVIVVIYVFIIRNPNALNWLKGLGKKTGEAGVGETVAGGCSYPDSSSTHPDAVALGTKVGVKAHM